MTKPGRNQPCPCGSGKKYKACCLRRDEEEARAAEERARVPSAPDRTDDRGRADAISDEDLDQLDSRSNHVVALIRESRLDDAEAAARDLLVRYPGFMDGHLRLAMVCEARQQREQAAAHYRDAAACLDDDCSELRDDLLRQASKLASTE